MKWPIAMLAIVAGCWADAPPPAPPAPPSAPPGMTAPVQPKPPLELELLVSAPRTTMATRNALEIGLRVTNNSDHTIEPHLHLCRLLVDGQRSMVFSGAVGNGMRARNSKWRLLPAGNSIQQSWALGMDLFDHPGDYTLELELEGVHSAPVIMHVDP